MEPEAGRHPSHPVVERSWDAIFLSTIQDRRENLQLDDVEWYTYEIYGEEGKLLTDD